MPLVRLQPESSVLVVVDIQPTFMKAVHEAERVLNRSLFLVQIAETLGIRTIATEQNPSRLGGLDERLLAHISTKNVLPKMTFSCAGRDGFEDLFEGRKQVVLVGAETHICVALTANDLLSAGYEVVVCPDALSSRNLERHKLGMERIRDAGGVPAHTETVAYEWLQSADNPRFKEALAITKAAGL